jgi:AcrR family transcriptional regulator
MTAGRMGRRPGNPEVTRRSILAAARSRFGEAGFDRATIRSIAAEAGVDPALVHHHFGTKQELFAAAHELPIGPKQFAAAITSGPRTEMGERIARLYLSLVETPDSAPLSLLRAAATNEQAARMTREFIDSNLLRHADELIELPQARLRLALVGSHMIGVLFGRALIGIPELTRTAAEELAVALGPTLQRYLADPDVFGARS